MENIQVAPLVLLEITVYKFILSVKNFILHMIWITFIIKKGHNIDW